MECLFTHSSETSSRVYDPILLDVLILTFNIDRENILDFTWILCDFTTNVFEMHAF